MATKRIIGGDLDGFKEITVRTLVNQSIESVASKIPTYTVPVVEVLPVRPKNCKGGYIENCQNYAWCAQCAAPLDGDDLIEKERIVLGFREMIDMPRFLAQKIS